MDLVKLTAIEGLILVASLGRWDSQKSSLFLLITIFGMSLLLIAGMRKPTPREITKQVEIYTTSDDICEIELT